MEKKASQATDLFDGIIRWSLIIAVALIPLILSPINFDLFDLPKASLLYLLALTACVSFIARSLLSGELVIKRTPLNKPLLAFAAMVTIATVASPIPIISLVGEYGRYENLPTLYSFIVLCFLATQFLDDAESRKTLISISFISFGIISFYGILQALGFDILPAALRDFSGRGRSTLGNPVFFGGYLALMIPLLLTYLIDEDTLPSMPKTAIGMLLVLGVAGIVLSQSRGAWVGLIVGIIAVVVIQRKNLTKGAGTALAMLVFGIAFAVLVMAASGTGKLQATITSVENKLVSAVNTGQGTQASRIEIWKSAVEMISVRPLEGYGPDQMYAWASAFTTLKKAQLEINTIPDRTHNIFLQVAVNGGLISLLVFLWIIIALAGIGLRALKNNEGPVHTYAVAVISGLIAYVAQGLTGVDVIGISAPMWVLGGSIAALPYACNAEQVTVPLKTKRQVEIITAVALLASVLLVFSLKPLVADTYYFNGVTYKLVGLTEQATAQFGKAVDMDPYQPQYRRDLVMALVNQGNSLKSTSLIEQGISAAEEGLRYDPDDFDLLLTQAGAYRIYAGFANDQSLIGQAETYYSMAINKNPYSTNPRRGLLGLYMVQEKYTAAIEQAKAILRVDPTDGDVTFRLAQAYEKTAKVGRAKALYKELLRLNPKQEDVQAALDNIEYGSP